MATVQPMWGEIVDAHSSLVPDDLPRLHDMEGYNYELYEGVLVRHMTSPLHGDICQRLGFELGLYARTMGYPNRILQNALFDLTPPGASGRVVLAPAVSIVRGGTRPFAHVPHEVPLLAVEVAGVSQTQRALHQKTQTYLQAGVDEVWVVDVKARTVHVVNAAGTTTLNDSSTLTSSLLPGFSLSVRYLFDG